MRTTVFPIAVSMLATAAVSQQFQIALPRDVLGQKPLNSLRAPAAGDFDGDGLVDLVFYGPRVLRNRGSHFEAVPGGVVLNAFAAGSAVGDVDGDGDLDVVQSHASSPRLFLNDGTGVLTDATAGHMPAAVFSFDELVLVDVDADGDLDLLTAAGALLLNDGAGHFADVTAAQIVSTFPFSIGTTIVARDFDGDGDVDFVNMDGLHRNDGHGFFAVDPAAGVGFAYADPIFASDLDRDGDLDLVGGSGIEFINGGTGVFQPTLLIPTSGQGLWQIAGVADLDGDRDDDLLLTPAFAGGPQVPGWSSNDGAGNFVITGAQPQPLPTTMGGIDALVVDLDGDLDNDIVAEIAHPYVPTIVEVFYNRGDGVFANATDNGGLEAPVYPPTVADIDGDGDQDIVAGNRFRADGRGSFQVERDPFATVPDAFGTAADFDGDGDVDLVGRRAIWFNDGTGAFVAGSALLPANSMIQAAATADIDGDGDIDLVTAAGAYGSPIDLRVFVNDGAGNLTPFPAPSLIVPGLVAGGISAVAMLDADGDGDQDLFAGVSSQLLVPHARLLANDGAGHFTEVPFAGTQFSVYAAEVGDFEGDGDVDILTNSVLFVNGGNGQFTSVLMPGSYLPVFRADDVDGDGDLDIWTTTGNPSRVTLLANDGTNQFAAAPGRIDADQPEDPIVDLFLVDVDRDGDRDLVGIAQRSSGGMQRYPVVWWNHAHQLRAPHLTRTGGTLDLFVASIDNAEPSAVVAIAVSLQSADLPLGELGVLGVDLSAAAVFAELLPGTGTLAWSLPIPATPSLHGTTLFAQSLFFAPSSLRLSGAIASTILH